MSRYPLSKSEFNTLMHKYIHEGNMTRDEAFNHTMKVVKELEKTKKLIREQKKKADNLENNSINDGFNKKEKTFQEQFREMKNRGKYDFN